MELNSNIKQNNLRINPNFSGINRIMKKRMYQYPKFLEKLPDIYTRENGNVGTLPNDILNLIGVKDNTKTKNSILIRAAQAILNDANIFLSEIEIKKLEIADNLNVKNFINSFIPKLAKVDIQPKRIPRIMDEMRKRFTPQRTYIDKISGKAAKFIETNFKELGILSESDKVKITYLDQGKFKNAFKLEFLNKDNENIIHPKTLLSFKDKSTAQAQFDKIIEIIKKYYTTISEKEYITTINNIINNTSKKVIPPELKEKYREILMQLFKEIKFDNGENKFKDILNKTVLKEVKYNGIGAESNITQCIKHAAGSPLLESNFVPYYYLNLKHNIALSEFSDELLGTPKHTINLYKYGKYHDDIDNNKNNIVAGRVIDYGNIKALPGMEKLGDNSIIRRYYHKISQITRKNPTEQENARIQYWNNLYSLASQHKIANHNDILSALQESKSLIDPKNWYKLLDSESDTFDTLI